MASETKAAWSKAERQAATMMAILAGNAPEEVKRAAQYQLSRLNAECDRYAAMAAAG